MTWDGYEAFAQQMRHKESPNAREYKT